MGRESRIVVAAMLVLAMTACGTTERPVAQESEQPAVQEPAKPTVQGPAQTQRVPEDANPYEDEMETAKTFIAVYDSVAASPLEIVGAFAPSDRDSGYYRTEFRLGSFRDAYGVHCTSGEMGVDIVTYGDGKGIRVYADGPKGQVAQFYRDAFKILDPDVPAESIDDAINLSVEGTGQGFVTGSNLQTMGFWCTGDSSEAMLDSMHFGE